MMQIEGLNSIIHRIDELNMRFGINTATNYQENVNKTAAAGGVEQEKPQRLENGSFATELDKAMSMESRGAVYFWRYQQPDKGGSSQISGGPKIGGCGGSNRVWWQSGGGFSCRSSGSYAADA